jgi:hypothetical protein
MEKIRYKTQPRLFMLAMPFLGFVFMGFLFLLVFKTAHGHYDLFTIIVSILFLMLALVSFFYFITIKTIKLTKDTLIISYFFLPIKRRFRFSEIKALKQNTKEITSVYGDSWKLRYLYTDTTTRISLLDDSVITINSIGTLDFSELYKTFHKLKRGEGNVRLQKRNLLLYLLDNVDGLFWIFLLFVLNIGLAYSLSLLIK